MISVITPVYNGEKFIESCIKIVIDQNCPDVEHVIMDGGSTDGTVDIIKQYAEKYPHIRWVSEKDKGQSDAMNKGIAMAHGDIIGMLNVDDFYEPNILGKISDTFKGLPEPSLVVGNCNILGEEGHLKYVNKPNNLKVTDLLTYRSPFPLNPAAYFYHKSLHKKIGLYKVDEHYLLDFDFIIKAVQAAKVIYIDKLLGNHQQIAGTKTVESLKSGQHLNKIERLLEEHRNKLPLLKKLKVRGYQTFSKFRKYLTKKGLYPTSKP